MATTKPQPYIITHQPGDLLSVEEYAELVDPPGWRSELIRGVVHRMPTIKDSMHDWILSNLHLALGAYVKAHTLGRVTLEQVGYDLTPPNRRKGTAIAPDLAFVQTKRLPLVQAARQRKEYVRLAPDLAVEIVSPSQATEHDMTERAQLWLEGGTRQVWNIWPNEQKVDVWTPDEPMRSLKVHESLDGLDVVPGFTYLVANLFS